jgi:fatty-acyl-CoA synthase
MFHANSWGLAYAAPMTGCKLVLPGSRLDGASIWELLDAEQVNFSAAVPTVWNLLLAYLGESGNKLPHLEEVVIGGSAVPRSMMESFDREYGVTVIHAWGMTEMSPIGSICRLAPAMESWDEERRIEQRLKQGRPPFGVEMKIVDDKGGELPWDGETFGRLLVRGPWVVGRYYLAEEPATDEWGWFDTGDVAVIDEFGYMKITDRAKDVIKSGGEWISSVDLENAAMGHPDVDMAAVIGIPHPKWEERPLLIIKLRPGRELDRQGVLDFLAEKVARWWLPEEIVVVDDIPMTATGKINKRALRDQRPGE